MRQEYTEDRTPVPHSCTPGTFSLAERKTGELRGNPHMLKNLHRTGDPRAVRCQHYLLRPCAPHIY
ncbi:hypothetical protein PGIGA_G00256300, partial [Pangasianodon gigas]|nr:hypothetical protein [Pangasianodon gigas]